MRSFTSLITILTLVAIGTSVADAKSEFASFDEQISGHWSLGWQGTGDPTQCVDDSTDSIRGAGTEQGSFTTKTVPVRVGGFLGGKQSIVTLADFSAEVPAEFTVTRTAQAEHVSCYQTTQYAPEQMAGCNGTKTFRGTASADLGSPLIDGNQISGGVAFLPNLDRDVFDCPFRFGDFSPAAADGGLYAFRKLPKSVIRNARLGKPIVLKIHRESEESDTSVKHVITHQPTVLDVTVTLTMRCHVKTGGTCPR